MEAAFLESINRGISPKIFSKYIDIQKDLSDDSSEIKTVQKLPDDELLDEVAAEAAD